MNRNCLACKLKRSNPCDTDVIIPVAQVGQVAHRAIFRLIGSVCGRFFCGLVVRLQVHSKKTVNNFCGVPGRDGTEHSRDPVLEESSAASPSPTPAHKQRRFVASGNHPGGK